ELDQHRQVDTRKHLHAIALHHGDREIGGGAAEHVGEQHHPVARIAALDTGFDLGPAVFHIVVRADTDGVHVSLGPDHVFHGGTQRVRQRSVGNQNHADHGRVYALPGKQLVTSG